MHVFNTPHYILPAPSDIAVTLVEKRALLLKHSLVTLEEMLLGFVLAAGIGIPLAVLMFEFPVLEKAFYPYVIGSQTVPVFAIAPLLVLWFGFGIASKVIMAALIVFFAMVLNTLDGLKSADPDTVNLCRILQASRWQILWKVYLPSALSVHLHRREDRHICLHDWCGNRRMGGAQARAWDTSCKKQTADSKFRSFSLRFSASRVLGVGLFGLMTLIETYAMPWRRAASRQSRT